MKMLKYLSLTLVAGLLVFTSVNSLSLPESAQPSGIVTQQQQQQQQQQSSVTQQPNTQTGIKDEKLKSSGRFLGGVGGLESGLGYQQQHLELPVNQYQLPISTGYNQLPVTTSYQAPVTTSYQAPVTTSYQAPVTTSYQAPVTTSYQAPVTTSYQAPVTSYSTQSYSAPVVSTYEQPIVQTYQQPIVSNYSTTSYSTPSYSTPSYSTPSYSTPSYSTPTYSTPTYSNYSTPIVTQSYSTPTYSNYTSSYVAPVQTYQQQSYVAPVQSYSAPLTSTYSQTSYVQPTYSNYSTPSYQTSTYSAPVTSSYVAPITTSYSAPVTSTYSQTSYVQPTYSNYSTPSYSAPVTSYGSSYSTPVIQTYEQQSYVAPVLNYTQSYNQVETYVPQVQNYQQQSYVAPVQNYQQQSYVAPVQNYQQQSYVAPVQNYQQQSYVAPVQNYQQQSYVAPVQNYQQQAYVAPVQSYSGNIVKRQLKEGTSDNSTSSHANEMLTSDSLVSATYALPPSNYQQVQYRQSIGVTQPSYVAPAYQNLQQQQYLDTQPEFTQSWADFNQPPGYLPLAFRLSYQQPQEYRGAGVYGTAAPLPQQTLSQGYTTWNGPINPSTFYTPVQLPYYYRIPGLSPFYSPAQGVAVYQQQSKLLQPVTTVRVGGYAKRSTMSGTDAPYQLLVDHLAAGSTEVFSNVSAIECPAKPTDYTCPQMLNLNKEELKKKLCEYESVLSGVLTLLPDTEKAQTRCGAIKITKQDAKNEDEVTDLPEKMAVVLSKECQLNKIMDGQVNNDQVYVLLKTVISSGTKYIVIDGSNVDLLNSQAINKDELSQFIKQCPKKSQ